jgi:hypothetical protein
MDTFAFLIIILSTFMAGGTLYFLATWVMNYFDQLELGDLEDWEYDEAAFEYDETDTVRSAGTDQSGSSERVLGVERKD